MKETVTKVDYFSMNVPDKPGEAARALKALDEAGVNLLAFTGFPNGRRGQLDFIPENAQAFKDAAKRIKLKLNPKKSGFIIQGEDQRGAIGKILSQLGEAKINVTAIDAVSAGQGRYGAILWVQPRDVNKAAKVFGVIAAARM
jgi:hypothetical protein